MKILDNKSMIITCKCRKKVVLILVGRQYQYSYRKICSCGREWVLEDISEDLTENKME